MVEEPPIPTGCPPLASTSASHGLFFKLPCSPTALLLLLAASASVIAAAFPPFLALLPPFVSLPLPVSTTAAGFCERLPQSLDTDRNGLERQRSARGLRGLLRLHRLGLVQSHFGACGGGQGLAISGGSGEV